jgi:large subunit ribosomal protein L5
MADNERYVPRLKVRYRDEIRPQLQTQLGLGNIMEVPRLEKIVVNAGVGDAVPSGRGDHPGVGRPRQR